MQNEFNIKTSQQAIDNATLLTQDLWAVTNVFEAHTLENILVRVENETAWLKAKFQDHLPRRSLSMDSDLYKDIRETVKELNFSKFGFTYHSLALWKDSAGYKIDEHSDNEEVIGAMQIYLNDAPCTLGTWFGETEIPFVKNTGYIMDNKNRPEHSMKDIVPDNITRYSMYIYLKLI